LPDDDFPQRANKTLNDVKNRILNAFEHLRPAIVELETLQTRAEIEGREDATAFARLCAELDFADDMLVMVFGKIDKAT
jgi:hypothetical protein